MAQETILVVEDSPTELRLVSAALRKRGYRVITAGDGEEALRQVAAEMPDLVLLDIILPKMNGFQVCRTLKGDETTRDIKVLILTSKTQDSDRFWGLRQGADEYLTKPVAEEQLLAAVGSLL